MIIIHFVACNTPAKIHYEGRVSLLKELVEEMHSMPLKKLLQRN